MYLILIVSEEPLDTTLTSTSSCPPMNWFDGDIERMETTDSTGEFTMNVCAYVFIQKWIISIQG